MKSKPRSSVFGGPASVLIQSVSGSLPCTKRNRPSHICMCFCICTYKHIRQSTDSLYYRDDVFKHLVKSSGLSVAASSQYLLIS